MTVFLGGYNLPYFNDSGFAFPGGANWALPHLAVVVLQVVTFSVKTFLVGCFQIQVRWTLPRFRYDQLMSFGWKFLLPLAAINLVVTVCMRWLTCERGMKKRYWNKPQMGFRERIYFIEIVRGLGITVGVFFRNMWKWLTFRKGALTAYYPEERAQRLFAQQSRPPRADAAPERRGAVRVLQHVRDRVSRPTASRSVSAADFDDPQHPKAPKAFEIDYSRCIFCGFCVEACPEDAIRMVKDVPDLPGFDRRQHVREDGPAKLWRPTSDPRKPYPAPPVTTRGAAMSIAIGIFASFWR